MMTEPCISVEEIKAYLKVEYDDENQLLETLISQGQTAAEDYCRVEFGAEAPEPVRLAIILFATHFFENRDNTDRHVYAVMIDAFRRLLYPYRDPEKMF